MALVQADNITFILVPYRTLLVSAQSLLGCKITPALSELRKCPTTPLTALHLQTQTLYFRCNRNEAAFVPGQMPSMIMRRKVSGYLTETMSALVSGCMLNVPTYLATDVLFFDSALWIYLNNVIGSASYL